MVMICDMEIGEMYELLWYFVNITRSRLESYREDVEVARRVIRKVEDVVVKFEVKCKIYWYFVSVVESGFDFSLRWFLDGDNLETIRTCNIILFDLNGFMLWVEM